MGECVILRGGGAFFGDLYTATAADVRADRTFFGNGSDDIQQGKMPVVAAINQKLTINGIYNIPAGYHGGQDKIYQEIPTQGATTVQANAAARTIEIAGKYMTGNVTISAADNFRAEYIKRGVTVGEGSQAITGTFEGFV